MITLSKIFSRERSLFYLYLWMESDRHALLDYLQYELRNSLYTQEGKENKVSVWYDPQEYNRWQNLLIQRLAVDPTLIRQFKDDMARYWSDLAPFLSGAKRLENIEQFEHYYQTLVSWWAAMANTYYIPNLDVPENVRQEAIVQRSAVERYSDTMDRLCIDFWKLHFPKYTDLACVVSPYEMIAAVRDGVSHEVATLFRNRLNGFGLYNGTLYPLDVLMSVLRKNDIVLERGVIGSVSEVRGVVVCRGYVRGIVKQILLKKQVASISEGEILVAEMTTPDFLPAMKKAAAIVTDEGGIMCHAAIIARELKKPCIIGTKIATQVFRDGDFVEVDAEKGIVRKL